MRDNHTTCPICGNPKTPQSKKCRQCWVDPRPIVDNRDGTSIVPLTQGHVSVIDTIDSPVVAVRFWHACVRKHVIYARAKIDGKIVPMQNLILPPLPGHIIDHINGDGLDNRRANLRQATYSQNAINTPISQESESGYKGVHWSAGRKAWIAKIRHNHQDVQLGAFSSAENAAKAYDAAARHLFGEFAFLNFPDEHNDAA